MTAKKSLTMKKQLRTHQPLWAVSPNISVKTTPHPSRKEFDVIIVGAGISGAFMAHALAAQFECVVIVDRRAPIKGSTSASTALLQFEIDQPLTKLADKIGFARARHVHLRGP